MIVIGADHFPLDDDSLLDEAKRRAAENQLEIITETQLWQRLGLVENEQNVRRLYTPAMLAETDPGLLQCSSSRVVTAQGIYACPILVGKPEAYMGHGARERDHYVKPARQFRPGSFGDVMKIGDRLNPKPKARDPYGRSFD